MRKFLYYLMLIGPCLGLASCQKQTEWLDVKRNLSDVSPSSLADLQAVLDNSNSFNAGYPMLGLLGTDNLYLAEKNLSAAGQIERNAYLWVKDIFQTSSAVEFATSYIRISAVNVVLEGLDNLKGAGIDQQRWNNIRGQALFHRAFAYYGLSQLFCKPYQKATAASDQGLQLRISSDPNLVVKRSSVAQTYEFMLDDLKQAIDLLPQAPAHLTRPGKAAARGLLAKLYLAMKDYENAAKYSLEALGEKPMMLDFNSGVIKSKEPFVFPAYSVPHQNPEIVFYANAQSWASMWPVYGVAYVDSVLYASYAANDLRKSLFFKIDAQGSPQFTGSYSGTYYNFGGIATNELALILAESLARTGNAELGLEKLNALLVGRFKSGSFKAYSHLSDHQTLDLILSERRKELAFTGQLRWEDLRRMPPVSPIIHIFKGKRYELGAGDPKWVFPLPDQEIALSEVEQNPR